MEQLDYERRIEEQRLRTEVTWAKREAGMRIFFGM
jgi:hypothetical protein